MMNWWSITKQTKHSQPVDGHPMISARHRSSVRHTISCIQSFSDFIIDTKEAEKMLSKNVFHGDFLIRTLIHIPLKPVFAEVKWRGLAECWIDVLFRLISASHEGEIFSLWMASRECLSTPPLYQMFHIKPIFLSCTSVEQRHSRKRLARCWQSPARIVAVSFPAIHVGSYLF